MDINACEVISLIDKNIIEYNEFQYKIINRDSNILDEGYSIFQNKIGKYYECSKILANNLNTSNYLFFLKSDSRDVRCSILTLIRDSFILYNTNIILMEFILYISIDGSDEERVLINSILTKEMVDFYKNKIEYVLIRFVENSEKKYYFDYYTYNYLYELLVRFENKDLQEELLMTGRGSSIKEIHEAYTEIVEDL